MGDLVVAIGLLLAIEGLLYAAIPDVMRRAVASMLEMPETVLRTGGLAAAVFGVVLIWIVRG